MPKAPPRPSAPAVSNPFATATSELPTLGRFVMIYAPPGGGKTSLAAQFPSPLFVITSGETGIHYLKKRGVADTNIPVITLDAPWDESNIPAGTPHPGWVKLIDTLGEFLNSDHQYQTLVLDTTSGADILCLQTCGSLDFGGDMVSRSQDSWNHYANGPRTAARTYWQSQLINLCTRIRDKGKNVILLAHEAQKPKTNFEGSDYEMVVPQLTNQLWQSTHKDLTDLLYMFDRPVLTLDKATKKPKITGKNRFIGVSNSTFYNAKNWHDVRGEFQVGETASDVWNAVKENLYF